MQGSGWCDYKNVQTLRIQRTIDEKNNLPLSLEQGNKYLQEREGKQNKSDTDDTIENIITDINKITNNGESVNDVFTNIYYVNDINEDKRCAIN